jgi:superfamily II DNA or RNA helicase
VRFFVEKVLTRVECDFIGLQYLEDILRFPVKRKDDELESLFYQTENAFYSGLMPLVETRLKRDCVNYEIIEVDEPVSLSPEEVVEGITPDLLSGVVLRDYQIDSIRQMLLNGRGIVSLPTGGGKTVIAEGVMEYMLSKGHAERVVYLTHSVNIFSQVSDRFIKRWGEDRVGLYGSEDKNLGAPIIVAMIASAYSRLKKGDRFLADTDIVIVDEAHHAPAVTWTAVLEACDAPWRWGLTATPDRELGGPRYARDYLLRGLLGNVIIKIPIGFLVEKGHVATPYVIKVEVDKPEKFWTENYREAYNKSVVNNEDFHEMVAGLALQLCFNYDFKVLILTREKKHGVNLLKTLKQLGHEAHMYAGQKELYSWQDEKVVTRKEDVSFVADLYAGTDPQIIVGTGAIGEGVDFPSANVLMLAHGGRSLTFIVQGGGRAMREKPDDNRMFVVDFVLKSHNFFEAQATERSQIFSALGYKVITLDELAEMGIKLNAGAFS